MKFSPESVAEELKALPVDELVNLCLVKIVEASATALLSPAVSLCCIQLVREYAGKEPLNRAVATLNKVMNGADERERRKSEQIRNN